MREDKTCINCNYCRFDERVHAHRCIGQESVRFGRVVDRNYCCNNWDGEIWEGPDALYYERYYLNDTILKHSDIICRLIDERVVAILFDNDEQKYFLQEQCDEYFSCELSLDDCRELSALFGDMADSLSEVDDDKR